MKLTLTRVLLLAILALGIILFFLLVNDAVSPGRESSEPTAGPTTGSSAEPGDPVQCPVATPEFFNVEPVTSPTNELSQIVTVDLGNGETITITTESGTFTAPFDTFPKEIEITLLPDMTHNLTVEGRVREVVQGECIYGGYTLSTTRDRYGDTLVIEQEQ